MTDLLPEDILNKVLPFSRYAQRLLQSEPNQRELLLQNIQHPFLINEMKAYLDHHLNNCEDEATLHRILRTLRKTVLLRLIARDLGGLADLSEVMRSMSALAEITLQFTTRLHYRWLTDPVRFGIPKGDTTDMDQQLVIVAMGKLGGQELNVSSDIDLIFLYPEEGETNGVKSISNHDFFARLGRKIISSLNDYTADGYVFRVDTRLRPYGERSPLAISFDTLKEYFDTQGREWERHAWIKGHIITQSDNVAFTLTEKIIWPFVFRKYLDFGAYASMRKLHATLRKEVERREMHENIKLGPGGIREIEFITQVYQLIRGGHDVDLHIQSTITALNRLRRKQQLPAEVVNEILDAYLFQRKLEHRLQYLDDQQTHSLPMNTEDQVLIAQSMGYDDFEQLIHQLDVHRMHVTHHFERILAQPNKSPAQDALKNVWQEKTADASKHKEAATQLSTMGFSNPKDISTRLQQFYNSTYYQELPQSSQQQINTLTPLIIEAVAQHPPVEITLERMLQLLEKIAQPIPEEADRKSHNTQHSPYLTLLLENPNILQRVAKLICSSEWVSGYLGRHPMLLDELLRHDTPHKLANQESLKQDLLYQLNHINNPKSDVIGWKMDVLRHFQHAQIFQLLFNDLEGLLKLEELSDYLTDLADLILEVVLELAWQGIKNKQRAKPAFAIIGYGKLGGKELGYVSDLDIIFLYDDTHHDAAEIYIKLSQSILGWLTPLTSAGTLYKTDTRLRPNGADGLHAHSISAFKQYQRKHAWAWEHQALTRARFIAGNQKVAEKFELARKEILCQKRDLTTLKQDIIQMRQKMLKAHPNTTDLFDIKHDRGGIIDVEFIVQYLVLGYANNHPQLTNNIGNIALLKRAAELNLIDAAQAKQVRAAYRQFRRLQHKLRLNGSTDLTGSASITTQTNEAPQPFARIEFDTLNEARTAVLQLWETVLGNKPHQQI